MAKLGFRGCGRGGLAALSLGAFFLLAAPALAAGHHRQPTDTAGASIIAGQPASIASLPSLAAIDFSNGRGGGFGCTGTVVAPRFVLTAGHCVENLESGGIYPPDGYTVITGVTKLSEAAPVNASAVVRVLAYPEFLPSRIRNDAGLLQLAAPVSAPALPLAEQADGPLMTNPSTPVVIAGWGLTAPNGRKASDSLLAAEAFTQTAERCAAKSRLFYPYFSPASQFCTLDSASAPSRTCHGDSGGPAIARRADGSPVEIGITSLGEENCTPGSPSIYTRVDRVSGWVKQWIDGVEHGGPLPKVVVPVVRPPFLSIEGTESLAYIALSEAFRNRFERGGEKQISCRRINREKVKCAVAWNRGPNDYYGTITIYLTVSRSEIVWGDRFKIHWINHDCRIDSDNRGSCRVHTVRR